MNEKKNTPFFLSHFEPGTLYHLLHQFFIIFYFDRNEQYMEKQDTIDLHGLHTKEALHALINFLDNARHGKLALVIFCFKESPWKQSHGPGFYSRSFLPMPIHLSF